MKYNLSIIIPYRNNADMLKQLLISIGNCKDVQTIIVDDASDQNLNIFEEIKKDFNSDNFVFLRNKSSIRSAGRCRNIGLENATGRWVLFADSDDYFLPNYYEIVSNYFNSNNDVVFFYSTSIDITTGQEADRHIHMNNIFDSVLNNSTKHNETKLRYTLYVPWSKLINREFILKNKINFDETFVKNDSLFSVTVGNKMFNYTIDKNKIYCSTWHTSGNLSKGRDRRFAIESTKSRINLYNFMKDNLTDEEKAILNFDRLPYHHVKDLKSHINDKNIINESRLLFKENGYNTAFSSEIFKMFVSKLKKIGFKNE